jgi:hypothetical protein
MPLFLFYDKGMRRTKSGSTPRQYAYAVKKLNGDGRNNKEIALSVGYPPSTANNTKQKIEKTEGYQNAVIKLANESNNMALAVMTEFKARGLKGFSNKDLVGALNAIGNAWERFNKVRAPSGSKSEENPLRKVILQRVENQTIHVDSTPAPEPVEEPEEEEVDLDF